jgi:SPOR domain
MADNEDFTFEEESFLEAEALEESAPSEGPFTLAADEDESPPVKQNSLLRILLLVLLLVVLGGAAFYHFIGVPESAPPVAAVAQKQPVSVPAPPAASAPETKQVATSADQPAATMNPAAVPVPAKPEAAKPAVAISPVKAPPATSSKTAPVPAIAPTALAPAASAVAVAATPEHFTLRSGAYLLASSLAEVEKVIRKLGYEPVCTPVQRQVAMTRLKVGTYPPAEAAAKLASLASAAPDSFVLTHDGRATVYAGSYLILDQARSYADHLYSQGIRVEEEPARVKKTLQRVSFGDFANRKEAEAAAARARAANLEAAVVKRR